MLRWLMSRSGKDTASNRCWRGRREGGGGSANRFASGCRKPLWKPVPHFSFHRIAGDDQSKTGAKMSVGTRKTLASFEGVTQFRLLP